MLTAISNKKLFENRFDHDLYRINNLIITLFETERKHNCFAVCFSLDFSTGSLQSYPLPHIDDIDVSLFRGEKTGKHLAVFSAEDDDIILAVFGVFM